MDEMSICGTMCRECDCYGELCKGCNACRGKVFYCGGKECPIYRCCVSEQGLGSCVECRKLPCEIWQANRDPKYSDEEFQDSIAQRVRNLKQRRAAGEEHA